MVKVVEQWRVKKTLWIFATPDVGALVRPVSKLLTMDMLSMLFFGFKKFKERLMAIRGCAWVAPSNEFDEMAVRNCRAPVNV